MSMIDRIRPDLAAFAPYASARRAGVEVGIRLDANESPQPMSGDSLALNRYPSPQPAALLDAMAALYDVSPERVWTGRGSDEAIDLLMRLFCRAGQDNIATLSPTFGMYRVAAQLQGAAVRTVPLDAGAGFALDPCRLLEQVDAGTKIVVLCSPNNPTGTLYHEHVPMLAERLANRALLLVDEAYIEFSDVSSAVGWLDRYDNLAVLRTLSKAHALAGARVGALLAHPEIIHRVAAIAAPYPLPLPSVAAALQALDAGILARTRERIAQTRRERDRILAALASADSIETIWPSAGNFLLIRCSDVNRTFRRLLAADVLVRNVSTQPGLAQCLRVTIGTPDENNTLLTALGCTVSRANVATEAAA